MQKQEFEGMRNAWFLASRGTREYKNKVMVKGSRDTKGLQVMQIVMGDEHTFDCWVSYKQPNGKVIAIKPHLAAWVDMRSRVIMGDVMCKDANSDILKQSLLKMIYSEPGGVPEYLYIDNGKDYTAKTMTGRDRNDRSGMNFDNETMGFYKSIGIKDDHRALPYEPWSKGQIERFFRTVCNKFTRWMKSYTGTLTGSKTSDKVDKDIKRMLERGELLTLEEFYEKWHELAEQMNERLAEMKMTKAEAALKMNYSRAALSQYLNGKYASDPTELEKKVREFLAATGGVAEGQEPENSVPTGAGTLKKKVEFFESRDFVQTIGVCQACQEYMGLGIIVGKSGQGKTHALKKYAELPRVAYIECDDTMACRDLVEAIENGIGLPKGYGGTIWSRVNRIREFFNTNEGFLLIIDEADKLINKYTQKKMEILRGIFDQSNVGIVIAGEPRLETELKGNLARFANRMDFYYKLKGLSKNEVVDYLEGYEVDEAAMGEMISRATNTQSGCFRLLDRTLNNVLRILKQKGETRITMKIVSEASNMMML